MCIFINSVYAVSDTRIFARAAGPGRQYLAYEMSFGALEDTAMILPLPVASRDERTALRFIDLSATPDFFDRLSQMVVMFEESEFRGGSEYEIPSIGSMDVRPPLRVHEVGAFDASFVPSIGDFDRLDARFRLPPEIEAALPQYRDYGFAVFCLRATDGKALHVHPMAFEFSTRFDSKLFIPTVHVHDGSVPRLAWFDHIVFAQSIRWPASRAGFYEDGIRAEAEKNKVLEKSWLALREQSDWRYRRATEGEHMQGIVFCGQPAEPLAVLRWSKAPDTLFRDWCALPLPARAQIVRLAYDEALLTEAEKLPANIQAILYEATPQQRRGWVDIRRWMDVAQLLDIQPAALEAWQSLNESDRAQVLAGQPIGNGAAAWAALDEGQREGFARLGDCEDIPALMETSGPAIRAWTALPAERRDLIWQTTTVRDVFPLLERALEVVRKFYGHQGGPDVRRQVIMALLAAEPREEEGARRFLEASQVDTWWLLPTVDRLAALTPLLDASRGLYALGLSGMLANEDLLIDTL